MIFKSKQREQRSWIAGRYTNSQGQVITMHRALRKMHLRPFVLATAILLPILVDYLLWVNFEFLMGIWERIFNFWIDKLDLPGLVLYTDVYVPWDGTVYIPFPHLDSYPPPFELKLANVVVCLIIFVVSKFMPTNIMPITYMLRAILLMQLSSSFYFLMWPFSFPYDLDDYISNELTISLNIVFLAPIILGFVYYIFDIALWRKLLITAGIVGYFLLLLPFQYLLHAIIIHYGSLLFMPTLHILFGLLLDSLMFVGWYSFAMSWGPIRGEQTRE